MAKSSPWPAAERPTLAAVRERQRLIEAARHQDGDAATIIEGLANPEPRVRATAVALLCELERLTGELADRAVADPSPIVRRASGLATAKTPDVDVYQLLLDDDPSVVEVACFGAGERPPDQRCLDRLIEITTSHEEALCRESAVAALGALGDERGLPAILTATSDRATVRRRAILALAPFDGDAVEAALAKALDDRDWQVRQAAEDLIGPPETP